MSDAITFYFQDIFTSYNDWKQLINDNSDIVDYDDTVQYAFDMWAYGLLERHYHNCNIRYTNINDFIGELLNVYDNKFKAFMREVELINNLYDLTNDELAEISNAISSTANYPNENASDPSAWVSFISQQAYNKVNTSKLEAYLRGLNAIPTKRIYQFFKAPKGEMGFDDLFMNVQPIQEYFFKKGV